MVSIPISADTSAVQAGLEQLRSAIEKSGQAAKALKDIDLSHPEIAKLASDLDVVRRRFEDLARVGRGETAAAARQFVGSGGTAGNLFGPGGFFTGGLNAMYPDPARAERIRAQAGSYVLQGAPTLQPPAPQPPPQPAPPGLGSLLAGAWSMTPSAMSVLGPVMAIAGIGSLGVMAARAMQMAQQEGVAIDTLMRRINDSGQDFDRFRTAISESAKGLGITNLEAGRLATVWSRMTGNSESNAVVEGGRFSAGVGRAFGLDPEAMAATLGHAQFLGIDPGRFALMVGEAAAKGNQAGQQAQIAETFSQALERLARSMPGTTLTGQGLTSFSNLYTALNATGVPGLRGEMAGGLINTINQTLMHGGGAGMASQMLIQRGLAEHGVLSPYTQRTIQEGGMFAPVPGGGTLFGSTLEEFNKEYGHLLRTGTKEDLNQYQSNFENVFGVSTPLVKALQGAGFGADLMGMLNGVSVEDTQKRLQAAGVDITNPQFNASSVNDLIGIAAGKDLEGYRTRLLGRAGVTDDEKARLQGATGTELQDLELRLYARLGQEPTEGQQTRLAMADLQSALTELGRVGITPLTMAITTLTEFIKTIASTLEGLENFLGSKGPLAPFAPSPEAFGGESTSNEPFIQGFTGSGLLESIGRALGRGASAIGSWIIPGAQGAEVPYHSVPSAEQSQRIRSMLNSQLRQGWSFPRAVALTQEGLSESGLDPNARNPKSGAYGIWQILSADRRAQIEKYFGKRLEELSWDEQAQIPRIEMGSTGLPRLRAVGEEFMSSKYDNDYEGATNFLTGAYESPGPTMEAASRGKRALQLARDFPPETIVRVHPIEIVHKNDRGDILWTEYAQTTITPPTPNNAASGNTTTPSSSQPMPSGAPRAGKKPTEHTLSLLNLPSTP